MMFQFEFGVIGHDELAETFSFQIDFIQSTTDEMT